MEGLYGDDADYDEDGKPTWDDDIDIGDIVQDIDSEAGAPSKKKKKKKKKDNDGHDDDGVDLDAMDADVVADNDDDEWDGTEEMRKRKVEEYMDEVYGLDFNDMVRQPSSRSLHTILNYWYRSAECLHGSIIHMSNQKVSTLPQQRS